MKENVTILSIDDDPQICFALGELFKFQGWRAVSASDVASGLEAFRRYSPDIVSRIRLHLRLAGQNQPEPAASKGISGGTLGIIMSFLSGQSDYVTANEIAEGTGLAYQTVYRYLQHLVQEKQVERVDIYGKVGRPKQVFRKL